MTKQLLWLACLLPLFAVAQPKPTLISRYEKTKGQETATYAEIIDWYKQLDRQYEQAKLIEIGKTDIGKPLHLFLIAADKNFQPAPQRVTLLINNGIHPGEPEGIDATMMWARDMLALGQLPKNVLLAIVPVYNVDGCLNRGVSRINQNGPIEYGFRGNSRNFDLNRDFIKNDTENARSWQRMFQQLKPHVMIDNHTSNGADYQHILTYFATQKDKLHPLVAGYMSQSFQPELDKALTARRFEPVPYVNNFSNTPESGIAGFNDMPRYSSGYAALFNCFSFVVELHMLKDYPSRVDGTRAFMEESLKLVERDARKIITNKQQADQALTTQATFAVSWKLDRSKTDSIPFAGFRAGNKPSDVSGLNRLYYDRSAPFRKQIPYWNHFVPEVQVKRPNAYLIPQGWTAITERLERNGVRLRRLTKDSLMTVNAYFVTDVKNPARPYEGHFLHTGVQLRTESVTIQAYAGDVIVPVNQASNRYIVETLEPQGSDSFFAWNFFDSILDQKEHFSAYVFEEVAADLLKKDPKLQQLLAEKKAADKAFAESAAAQLEFIYRYSPYYERTHTRYPVYRLE